MRLTTSLSALAAAMLTASASTQEPETLREALGDVVGDGWIYEDIDAGYREARRTGKPLLVAFRCVP